jgi:hypothetical protein
VSPGVAKLTAGRPIHVQPFDNRSLESDAGLIAMQSATRTLSARGVSLASGSTPLVLVGAIDQVTATPLIITGPQQVAQWQLDARLTLQLREEGNPKPVAQVTVSESTSYLAATNGDVEGTEVSRRLAVQHLLEQMASDAVDRLAP